MIQVWKNFKKRHTLFQQGQKNKLFSNLRLDAVLAGFFGLLGEVFPALRTFYVDWDDKLIYLYFYYDGEISEDDYESAELIATEVIAHFSEHLLEVKIMRLDCPNPIPEMGILIYQRQEPLLAKQIKEKRDSLKSILVQDYSFSLRVKVLLSCMLGLLGSVTPTLRGVQVKWDENLIHMFFYYDGEISTINRAAAESVIQEMILDFPEHKLETNILRWDYPKLIPKEGAQPIYHRKEPNPESYE